MNIKRTDKFSNYYTEIITSHFKIPLNMSLPKNEHFF